MQSLLEKLYLSGFNFSLQSLRIIWAILILFTVFGFLGAHYPMMLPYWGYKLLHIIGITIIIGTFVPQLIMDKWHLSIHSRTMAFIVHKYAAWMSVLYYLATLVIVYSGLVMAEQWGGIYNHNWIFLSMFLTLLIYLIYHPVMDREILKIVSLLKPKILSNDDPEINDELSIEEQQIIKTSVRIQWGYTIVTLIGLIIILYCMVAKPELSWLTTIRTEAQHLVKIF